MIDRKEHEGGSFRPQMREDHTTRIPEKNTDYRDLELI